MRKIPLSENEQYLLKTYRNIVDASKVAIKELLEVAKEKIIKPKVTDDDFELAADKMKNAAAAKKLAIFDALEIAQKIELIEDKITDLTNGDNEEDTGGARVLAEGRSRSKR